MSIELLFYMAKVVKYENKRKYYFRKGFEQQIFKLAKY